MIVTRQEYNRNFMLWLQLTFGRICKCRFRLADSGRQCTYTVSTIKYKGHEDAALQGTGAYCRIGCNEKFPKIGTKIYESSILIQDKLDKNFSSLKKDLIGAIMQIFKSSDDVDQ